MFIGIPRFAYECKEWWKACCIHCFGFSSTVSVGYSALLCSLNSSPDSHQLYNLRKGSYNWACGLRCQYTWLAGSFDGFYTQVWGPQRAYPIFFLFRVASYLLLIALMLAVAGVNPTVLLAGGTFAGLVVGLAGQTVLSNLFAGLLIVFAKPFSVGDRVTAFGWQLVCPSHSIHPSFTPRTD